MENKSLVEIVGKHTGDVVREFERITNRGTVNEIYVVAGKSAKYILRSDLRDTTIDRFQKEKWCMEAAHEAGIPGPRVLGLGMRESRPYLLISYIEGTHGEDAHASKQFIWSKLGHYARKIHSIEVKGFGDNMILPGVFGDSWVRYLDYNISELTADDILLSLGLISPDESAALKNAFAALKNPRFNFGLIHGDLALRNTILASDETVYLLDWGSAQADVIPHPDFAEILHASLNQDSDEFRLFLHGYGVERKELARIAPEMKGLQLLRRTDTLRWAVDRRPDVIPEKAKDLKTALSDLT
jgi:aminoglycoside phosphotransferase (APT) family kinase protein